MEGSLAAATDGDGRGVDDVRRHEDSGRSDSDEVDNPTRYTLAWWLSFAVPISIALVAILGAVVGYRVEDHASLASAADTDAQVASTYKSGHVYDALLTGQVAEAEHDLWVELARPSGKATGLPMMVQAEPSCAIASGGAASLAEAQRAVDCQLAQVFSKYALPAYWKQGDPARFNTERFLSDYVALGNLGRDVAVSQHEAVADAQRHAELRLLWLALLLAVALAFCTLAQATLHHHWTRRTTRASLLLAVPGWVLLIGCAVTVLAWEI